MAEESERFEIGQVVWAKITGYPWWPAQVFNHTPPQDSDCNKSHREYSVMFFGDNSHAYLPPSKLEGFLRKYAALAAKQHSKKFQQALVQADRYMSTGQGSLLQKQILIDSHPVCCSADKSTTLAHEDKVLQMADLEELSEDPPFFNASVQQTILFQQFSQDQLVNINHVDIVDLLERGLIKSVRQAGYQQSVLKDIEDKFKTELFRKYQLLSEPVEEPLEVETPTRRTGPKIKRQYRKRKSESAVDRQSSTFKLKQMCIAKLYYGLKRKVDRTQAMKSSVSVIERCCDNLQFPSEHFKAVYLKVLQWLKVTTKEYIGQKLEQFVQELVGGDQKSKDSVETSNSYK